MSELQIWYSVAIIALITAGLRFIPFIIFGGNQKTPKLLNRLGKMLPYAIMGMLVVYCLKDVNFLRVSNFLPAMIACLIVGVLYVWKRNTLVSIVAGTVCYMFLVQILF